MLERTPKRPSVAGWVVDREAVSEALLELELELPLSIGLTTGWRKAANYRATLEGHRIRLSGRHPLERANGFLWHELAHARQNERNARLYGAEMDEAGLTVLMMLTQRTLALGPGTPEELELREAEYRAGGAAHRDNPLEVEARAVADAYAPTWALLCRTPT